MTQTLPIHEILVEDRYRQDLGDITSLAESIARVGLLQPIVVTPNKRLIAGGRRYAACVQLGFTNIPVVYKEALTDADLHEMELEENIRRKDMTWQERCLLTAQIHKLKRQQNLDWGVRETGELMGVSKTHAGYTLIIARLLLSSPEHPSWQAANMSDAYREYVLKPQEELARAKLAEYQAQLTADATAMNQLGLITPTDPLDTLEYPHDPLEDARQRYLSNPLNDPAKFDEYWAERQRLLSKTENRLYLSNRFHNVDCIDFMLQNPASFDHIITDPPYAIDMDMLDQGNANRGMRDLNDILDAHDVEYNLTLLEQFFPAAYQTLTTDGFCVLWCDIMQWSYLYNLAIKSGFKVQRWPIVWNKLHRCINQSAQYNFTKDIELAMVCRKGNATLCEPALTCRIAASNDDMKRIIGHPFAKPFEVWEFITKYVSHEGQRILDPFCGRGSGAISLIRLNRRVSGCELEKNHYDALLENLKRYYLTINPQYIFL